MWTLKIERKMPIRTAGPPMNSSCSNRVTSAILPSAGETSNPGFSRNAAAADRERNRRPSPAPCR